MSIFRVLDNRVSVSVAQHLPFVQGGVHSWVSICHGKTSWSMRRTTGQVSVRPGRERRTVYCKDKELGQNFQEHGAGLQLCSYFALSKPPRSSGYQACLSKYSSRTQAGTAAFLSGTIFLECCAMVRIYALRLMPFDRYILMLEIILAH